MKKHLISKSIQGNKSELKLLKHFKKRYQNKFTIKSHCQTWNIFHPRNRVRLEVIENNWPKESINKVLEFFDKTEWDFVIAEEPQSEMLQPILIIDYDGLCQGQITNGSYQPKQCLEMVDENTRKMKFDDKIILTRDIGIHYVIVPPITDEQMGIEWTSYELFFDFVIGSLLADIYFDREWNNEKNWANFNRAVRSGASTHHLQRMVNSVGQQLEISTQYSFIPIPLFESERRIFSAIAEGDPDFSNLESGSRPIDISGHNVPTAYCAITYKNKRIEGTHPHLNFESNLGPILGLYAATEALCWHKVAEQIWKN